MSVLPAPAGAPAGGRGGVGDDAPVEHLDAAPHPGGDRMVVGDHDDRGAAGVELFQQVKQRRAGRGVQVARRLVGQHHRRAADDRPGDRHPLPFTAGQLGRPGAGPVLQADPLERGGRQAAPPGPRHARVQQPVGHVGQHGLVLGQEELLEHEADPGRPQRGHLPVGHLGHVQAGHPHRPAAWPVQGAHQVQQRALARPGRADHRGQFPGRHRHAHLVKRPHRRRPRILLRHPVQLQDRPSATGTRRRSRRRHHDLLARRQRPGHLHQAGVVVEDPDRHRHQPPGVTGAGHLDRVPLPPPSLTTGPAARPPAPRAPGRGCWRW